MNVSSIVESAAGSERAPVDYFYGPWLDWDIAGGLRTNMKILACLQGALRHRLECVHKIETQAIESGWILQEVSMSSHNVMLVKLGQAQARQDMAEIAVQAGAYRKAKGHWPALATELPAYAAKRDPFSEQPYIVRVQGDQFVLICVGSDYKEDSDDKAKDSDKDIVIRL
jgi:hypothetical protein